MTQTQNSELVDMEVLRSENLETSHAETIETVIYSLDSENAAVVKRTEGGALWSFPYGSVRVYVQFTGESDEDTFKVWSEVMVMPTEAERVSALLRRLLEMNWENTFEANFAACSDRIVVLSHRTVADLSAEEISRAITLVASLADDNDEALIAEFGGTAIG
ncbi:MAG: YbjN domain-containing protein [Cyanobacteria bacterium J06641_5]